MMRILPPPWTTGGLEKKLEVKGEKEAPKVK